LHYGAEKLARRAANLTAFEHFVRALMCCHLLTRLLRAAVRSELYWSVQECPCGPHNMQIGGHARSEGLIIVTK
jgi:tRNA(fMet)-specific endonuclease VapC